MESLNIFKIFVRNSKKTENRYNKNLFEFLNNNVEEIVDSDYYIRLILIDESNIDKFVKLGIKSTPALLDENENKTVTGVEEIIKYIVSKCENWEDEIKNECPIKKESTFTGASERNDNDLRSYFLNEVLSPDTIEEPVDINKVKNYEDHYNKNKDKLISKNVNTNKNIINNVKNNANNNLHKSQSIENHSDEVSNLINSNIEVTQTKKISSYMADDPDLKNFWENLESSEY